MARLGYGAMQLGDVASADDAVTVLRRAVQLGVNHIDTASFYAGCEVGTPVIRQSTTSDWMDMFCSFRRILKGDVLSALANRDDGAQRIRVTR